MYLDKFYPFLFVFIFSLPIFLFGINDTEMYHTGFSSALFFWESFENFFTFFDDFNGPGIKVPIGAGPMLHPLNIFFFDLRIFYFLFVFFHLMIQIEFTQRILKKLNIKYDLLLLLILLVFSLTNIQYGLSEDWIACFFAFTFFPVLFYYLIKILNKKKINDYLKFSLFFCFWLLNGHIGHTTAYIIFLLFYLILSIRSFDELKKIFSLPLFISVLFITLITLEWLFFLIRELALFDGWRAVQGTYSLIHFLEIFYPQKEFLSKFSIFRLPGNPILIYFCLFFAAFSFVGFLKLVRKKNINFVSPKSIKFFFEKIHYDVNFKLNILFVIFVIFSLLPFLLYIPAISVGAFLPRDIYLYLGIFIFFINIDRVKKFGRIFLIFSLVFYSLLYFTINIYEKIKLDENNYLLNRGNKSNLVNNFESLNFTKNDFKRIYLSPNFIKQTKKGFFKDDNIFAITDLNKFNLIPFNGFFKYTSFKQFGDEFNTMRGMINSHYHLINNSFFLELFNINFILIMKNEKSLVNNVDFELIRKIKVKNKELLLYKKNLINYSIPDKNLNKFVQNMGNCKVRTLDKNTGVWLNKDSQLDCLLRNENLFIKSDHKFKRISNGKFSVSNLKNIEYPLIPFVYDKSWMTDKNDSKINIGDFIFLLDTKKIKTKSIDIQYKDKIRLYLKWISHITMLILFTIIFSKKLNSFFVKKFD